MRRGRMFWSAFALSLMLPAISIGQRDNVAPIRVDVLMDKLGVKGLPNGERELELGKSTTTVLAEPQKLVPYGITGMHDGARVTITCVGPNRLRVEADELEPVVHSVVVTLLVGENGSLTVAPERAPPKQPPGK